MKYRCTLCGYIYDPEGRSGQRVEPGTAFEMCRKLGLSGLPVPEEDFEPVDAKGSRIAPGLMAHPGAFFMGQGQDSEIMMGRTYETHRGSP